MQPTQERKEPARQVDGSVVAAFIAIYVIWGSTFLAIRYAVESIPPFLMIGMRSTGAGAILYAWVRLKHGEQLRWRQWRAAAIGGFFFFVVCHGSLAWAEQRVPSGVAAVVLALIPIWVVLLDWLRPGGVRPNRPVLLGVLVGFAGLILLVGPATLTSGGSTDVAAVAILALSALAWAVGTLYSRYAALDSSPAATSAMQLLTGGGVLLLVGTVNGEWDRLLTGTLDARSVASLGYLIIFGSLIAFSAYIWLLQVSSPARVATYAYVNPVVAVLLGWAFGGEALTLQTVIAATVIVLAVAIITRYQHRRA